MGDENRSETDKLEWHATNKYPLVCVIVTHQNGARLILKSLSEFAILMHPEFLSKQKSIVNLGD